MRLRREPAYRGVVPAVLGGYSHCAMRRLTPLLILAGTLLATPCLAQGAGRNAPLPTAPGANRPPPPALPGLAGRRPVEPIPAETPASNLPPTAALFDAINRGDLGAVREAMGRGADLNARNQLGLMPLDAAVDQGRQEIVFYLLSARGSVISEPTQAPAVPAPAARGGRSAPAASASLGSPPAGRLSPEEDRPSPPSGLLRDPPRGGMPAPAAAMPARARLFAGDGGAPRPEIGFLGFDAGRPAGAEPLPETVQARSAARRRGA
ncbi:ankyrin repeat domain-containing protein [Roseomonas xinghualingensis]|uniref:ankyrin repeat domain-containing protein n=1 Tax=Roseomonas xinghualingensis TaxID=2986475 RepID=UPI0021F17E0A|nr:ankyrin repeat domain-containing protein [Roseomonas sp. SXEYE001]MCV4208784.1 ankyrin repeat domain-containing protein [Roseomonas sp. SXEYE001]